MWNWSVRSASGPGALAPLLDLELRFSCPMEHHLCALAPDALEQLLYHLLSNAFKFTPAGGTVTVELRRSPGPDFAAGQ